MKLFRFFAISLLALFVAGCASSTRGWMGAPLKDTSWQLVTIESKSSNAGRQYVANDAKVVMNLRASGAADFTLDCETGSSDWIATPVRVETQGDIAFDAMAVMAAPSPCEVTAVVQNLLGDLEFFEGYVLVENHLYLNTRAHATIYGWRKVETP